MKYLISERQYKLITEIERLSGHLEWSPLDGFYNFVDNNLPKKIKLKLFKKYFEKIFDSEIEKDEFFQEDVISFYKDPENSEWKDKFSSKDSLSGFAYFIAKNYFGLEEGIGLDYFVKSGTSIRSDGKVFYFFDPQLKIFVGLIAIHPLKTYTKKSYKVFLSSVDENLIGTGYGVKMYQNVLTKVDFLMSDDNLYAGSYRIWKHVLPKYANVWGISDDEYEPTAKKILPGKKVTTTKFDNFIASVKFDKI